MTQRLTLPAFPFKLPPQKSNPTFGRQASFSLSDPQNSDYTIIERLVREHFDFFTSARIAPQYCFVRDIKPGFFGGWSNFKEAFKDAWSLCKARHEDGALSGFHSTFTLLRFQTPKMAQKWLNTFQHCRKKVKPIDEITLIMFERNP